MSADKPGVPVEILPFLKQRSELSISGTEVPKPQPSPSMHYRCDLCPYETNIQQHYQKHVLEHKSQKDYVCPVPVCGKVYESGSRLLLHLESHEKVYNYVCQYCEKRFKSPALLSNHMKVHFPLEIPCQSCNKIFSSHNALKRHVLTVHPNENYPK